MSIPGMDTVTVAQAAQTINIEQLLWIAGIAVANIATIAGAVVSFAVKVGRLETRVDRCEKDIDNAWTILRKSGQCNKDGNG